MKCAVACLAACVVACSASSSPTNADASADASRDVADEACIPPAGACDAPKLETYPVKGSCLDAHVALADVCVTSVNRCTPSAGLVPLCAFAPDGTVYAAMTSDNWIPTAKGWRFAIALGSYPNPSAIPGDEIATPAEYDECRRVMCFPLCAGGAGPGAGTCPARDAAAD